MTTCNQFTQCSWDCGICHECYGTAAEHWASQVARNARQETAQTLRQDLLDEMSAALKSLKVAKAKLWNWAINELGPGQLDGLGERYTALQETEDDFSVILNRLKELEVSDAAK